MKSFALAIALTASSLMMAPAHAVDINFSFANTLGNVEGVVSGRIIGLVDNGWSEATDIIITSRPAGMVLPDGPFSVFANIGNWPEAFIYVNSFTLSNGQVVDAEFQLYGGYFDLNFQNQHNVLTDFTAFTGVTAGNHVYNQDGLNGVTFSAVVPEPASLALMGAGVVGLLVAARRRQPA